MSEQKYVIGDLVVVDGAKGRIVGLKPLVARVAGGFFSKGKRWDYVILREA